MNTLPFPSMEGFYSHQNILITGATGFIGKALLRKLLVTFPDIGNIYLLLRKRKDNEDVAMRFDRIFKSKLFDDVRSQLPDLQTKVVGVEGDLAVSGLGLSHQDYKRLTDNVSIVFHSAATVKFNETLRTATQINVIGTKRILELCAKLRTIKAFIYVSTAYSNCDKYEIKERLYPINITPDRLLELLTWEDDDALAALTPKLLGDYPNTYTWTKAVAEHLVATKSLMLNLPVAIIRPSIVLGSWKEPYPGCNDSKTGVAFLILAMGFGYITDFLMDEKAAANFIPVDVVVNVLLVAARHTAVVSNKLEIYNCTSGGSNSYHWGEFIRNIDETFKESPITDYLPLFRVGLTRSWYVHHLKTFSLYLLPAFLKDLFTLCKREKANYLSKQKQLLESMDLFYYFTLRGWLFSNEKLHMLESELNEAEKEKFFISTSDLHWKSYTTNYIHGLKRLLLKKKDQSGN